MNWDTHFVQFRTRHGTWSIDRIDGWYRVFFEKENLGHYASPFVALDELTGGSCEWPGVLDPSECGISDDFEDWTAVPKRPARR